MTDTFYTCLLPHEHLRDFKCGNYKTKFAQHLLENRHAIGPMENIMDTNHTTNKGKVMDTLETFYIFRETKPYNQTNDKITVKFNAIFETIVHEDPYKRHTTPLHSDASHITLS